MMRISSWHMTGVFLLVGGLILTLPAFALEPPQTVDINLLSNLYQGVEFDHQMHVDIAQDCSVCHHHTTGTGTVDPYCARCHTGRTESATVACQDCHQANPFSAAALKVKGEQARFHVDVYGLKGAYHRNCLGCHEKMGGPTGCQDCHARTEAGDKFYHAGKYAPPVSAQTGHGE